MNPSRLILTICCLTLLGGCIQRTITVTTEPAGALIHLNDEEIGRSPVTVPFEFYGTYDVRIEHEGYKTLHTGAEAVGPWWELPVVDLVAEMGDRRVEIEWDFKLEANEEVDPVELLKRARKLRSESEDK